MNQMSPEEAKALQEKLKNMSPEELREFQKKQCIFCHIIEGKVPSKEVFSDNDCIGVLDINPANPGHVLLLPKEHYMIMPQVPEQELAHLFMVAKGLSHAMLRGMKAHGTNIFVANGPVAGQKAQHFMIHIIPRMENDGVGLELPERRISDDDVAKIKAKLAPGLKRIFAEEEADEEEPEEEGDEGEPDETEEEPEEEGDYKEPDEDDDSDEDDEDEGEDQPEFLTSESAKRFHTKHCAFAQNIPEDKRIYLTKEQAEESDKYPCTCVTGKRIPFKKEDKEIEDEADAEPEEEPQVLKEEDESESVLRDLGWEEKEDEDEEKEDLDEEDEVDEDSEEREESGDEPDQKKSSELDDISGFLTGR